MEEGYLSVRSVIASYARMINLSIKHRAKYWKQKISNANHVIVWDNTLVLGVRHAIVKITFVEKALNMKRTNLSLVQSAATRHHRLRI